MSDLDVIIVHYHAAPLVRQAVDALERDAAGSGLAIHVIVADNGSTPEERALLRSLRVEYLATGRDAGYAGGVNFAFPRTRSDVIVIMNEDVVVLPGCLAALRDALLAGAAVAGPEFFWDLDCQFVLPCTEERTRRNELLKVSGKRDLVRLARARRHWREHARRHWRCDGAMPSTALSGALLAFRRDTWTIAGGLDDHYQMYFDENDWLFRIAAAGLQPVYLPRAKAVHLHNPKLAGEADRHQWESESFLRFGNRYYGETFMRRLFRVGSRTPVVPEWQPLNAPHPAFGHPLPPSGERDGVRGAPLWIELTPSPFGFPAAAARIENIDGPWPLPRLRGLPFLSGTLYLQLVDDDGEELARYAFVRETEAVPA